MSPISRNYFIWVVIPFVLFGSYVACTQVYTFPLKKVVYPSQQKINLNVGVAINEELRKAQWTNNVMGESRILPLGDQLALNTEEVAQAVFQQTAVVPAQSSLSENFDAILIPKVIDIVRTRPMWVGEDRTTSVIFEWTLIDPNGDLIWVDTITGEGTGPMGQPWRSNSGRKQVEKMLDDLFPQVL